MKKKTYYYSASIIFAIVAVLHALRAFYEWEAVIGDVVVPVWFSWAAVLIAGYLAVRGFMFAKKSR